MDNQQTPRAILDEADRIEENCDYSSQRHFETVTHWERIRDRLGLPTVVLAGVTSAAAFSQVFGNGIAAGIFALFVTVLSAVNTYLSPGQRAEQHRTSANAYLTLKNETRRFRTIHIPRAAMSEDELVERIETLAAQLDQLNTDSQPTPEWAYRKAQANIQGGQTRNRVDEATPVIEAPEENS